MKPAFLATLLVLLLAVMAFAGGPQAAGQAAAQTAKADTALDGDRIVENALKAAGGREKLATIKDRTIKAKLIGEGFEGRMEMHQKAPNKLHQLIIVMDQVVMESWFDGEKGVRMNPNTGEAPFSKEEIEEAKANRVIESFLDYKEHGEKARFVGMKKLGDNDVYEVEITTPIHKQPSTAFFDKDFNVVKVIVPLSVSEGPGMQELSFSDYRDVDGIKHWFKLQRKAGDMNVDLVVESVQQNTGLTDDVFRKK